MHTYDGQLVLAVRVAAKHVWHRPDPVLGRLPGARVARYSSARRGRRPASSDLYVGGNGNDVL